jgi:hypothetical protein
MVTYINIRSKAGKVLMESLSFLFFIVLKEDGIMVKRQQRIKEHFLCFIFMFFQGELLWIPHQK